MFFSLHLLHIMPFFPSLYGLVKRLLSGCAFWTHLLFFEAMLGRVHSNGCMLSALFKAACPVLCSGNGQYLKGRCMCHSGWKGSECDVPTNQCIDITCSSHGTCIVGTCICNPGYKGENCEEGDFSFKKICILSIKPYTIYLLLPAHCAWHLKENS